MYTDAAGAELFHGSGKGESEKMWTTVDTIHVMFLRLLYLTLAFSMVSHADDALLQRVDVKKALAYIKASHEKTLVTQVAIRRCR